MTRGDLSQLMERFTACRFLMKKLRKMCRTLQAKRQAFVERLRGECKHAVVCTDGGRQLVPAKL
jgi:hypothetical protein